MGEGIPSGDDQYWHLIYNYDLLYCFDHGYFGISPNHTFLGLLGYNTFLFYAPFPHYAVALFAYCFRFMGVNITFSLKFFAILSTYFSGVIVYKLAKKILKEENIAIAFGLAYIFFPYRIWNFLYRAAFSEGIALGILPLFFYGIYSLLHDKEFHIYNFVYTVLGASLLVLSHPFTALVSVIAAIALIISELPLTVSFLKKKKNLICSLISILLILGIISFYFFPMREALSSGYYRMSDAKAVWTDYESVQYRLFQTPQFSGFINFSWLDFVKEKYHWNTGLDTSSNWTREIILFLSFSILGVTILFLGKKFKKEKIAYLASIASILFPLIFLPRIEVRLATIILILSLLFIEIKNYKVDEPYFSFSLKETKKLALNPAPYVLIALLTITLLFLYNKDIWEIAPAILRNCQFPFRFWGIFGFLAILLGLYLLKPLSKNTFLPHLAIIGATLLYVLAQAPIDKRIALNNGNTFLNEPNLSSVKRATKIGVMNEYMPKVFYEQNYVPTYSNSLYFSVRNKILYTHNYSWDIRDFQTSFLYGNGDFNITSINSPEMTFNTTITENAYLQIEQFYYDGYQITLENSNASISIIPQYEDGLIAFKLPKGTYKGKLFYVGSKSYQIARPFLYLSLAIIATTPIVNLLLEERKMKEDFLFAFKRQ